MAVAFIALALLAGFVADLRGIFEERGRHAAMFGDLLVGKTPPKGLETDRWVAVRLTDREQKVVDEALDRRRDQVSVVLRRLGIFGLVTNGRSTTQFLGVGYDLEAGLRLRGPAWAWDTLAGQPLHRAGRERGVVLARELGRILECESAVSAEFEVNGGYVAKERPFTCRSLQLQLQTMTTSSRLNALTVEVTGLIDIGSRELGAQFIMTDLATAQTLLDTRDIDGYAVALKDPAAAPAFAAALEADARRAGVALTVRRWQDAPEGALFRSVVGLLHAFTAIVLIAGGVIAAFSVFNLLTRSVSERTREIGTLRSMGYRRWQIALLFTAEGLFVAALGTALGLVLAPLLSAGVSAMGVTFTGGIASAPVPLRIRIEPGDYLEIAVALWALCGAGAFLPARRASRLSVAHALAHV